MAATRNVRHLSHVLRRSLATGPSPKKVGAAEMGPSPPKASGAASSPFDTLGVNLSADALGPESSERAVIDALGPTSFTISGVRVSGSVLVMPRFSTLWNVDGVNYISPNAFALVKLVLPRPDVVVIGTGAELLPISPELRAWFREINVNVESMDTKNACHTFNVLNQESRNVAAALLPSAYQQSDPQLSSG